MSIFLPEKSILTMNNYNRRNESNDQGLKKSLTFATIIFGNHNSGKPAANIPTLNDIALSKPQSDDELIEKTCNVFR